MKNLKKILLLSVSLISTVALPINLGAKLANGVRRVMPKVEVAVSKVKATAQNVKAQAFPAFCKVVNVGIGTAPFMGICAMGIGLEAQKDIKNNPMAYYWSPNGLEDANKELAECIRGELNIAILVAKASGSEENYLREVKNLTYLKALETLPITCRAVFNGAIIISSSLQAALVSPQMFIDTKEHEKFCEFSLALLQKESGRCVANLDFVLAESFGKIAFGGHMLGKRMGPIAAKLLQKIKKNPLAETKRAMLARAVGGGCAKGVATAAGCGLSYRKFESQAQGYIGDEHKKRYIQWLYFANKSTWHQQLDHVGKLLLASHPAHDIKRLSGSIELAADYILEAEMEDRRGSLERERNDFLISRLNLETGRKKSLTSRFSKSDISLGDISLIDAELASLNHSDPKWADRREAVIKKLHHVTSIEALVDASMKKTIELVG